jgi:hypothetical protein
LEKALVLLHHRHRHRHQFQMVYLRLLLHYFLEMEMYLVYFLNRRQILKQPHHRNRHSNQR